ncbi:hypothetical protein PMI07_002074 [Rhizobium sp. CF080]|uniref:hypothetical protein n=1 Tax=Rhizobium sp. (strain CF080) TaxID=1144310 RepID=UPI0002719B0B|nr:hypothetical protein [Rhizobium sp. CF080]EUB95586.1 hypothetical protein PMI07_002074 [Rhizobium sp. CF080]
MKPDLETRIADAFGAELSSKQLSDLLAEVAQADRDAQTASEKARETALDPATRAEAVAQARKDMEDADFRRRRLERATAKLTELKTQAVQREQKAIRDAARAAAIEARDQVAKDLIEYEELSVKITNLLIRLKASNDQVSPQETAEAIARQAGDRWLVNVDDTLPKLLETVRLPKFRRDGSNIGYLWPQRMPGAW